MNPEILARWIEIVPIGFLSGLLAGAFGIGGGIISVPLIRHVLGLTPHEAVGSSLAMILPTAVIGVFNYLKQGKTLPKLSLICSGPAIIGTIVASAASHYIHGQILMLMLAALMVLVGVDFATGFGNKLKKARTPEVVSGNEPAAEQTDDAVPFVLNQRTVLTAASIGIIVGLLSGLLGIGGGFIMVPAFCYFLNLPLKMAFGTSLIVVALVALPGTVVHAFHKHVLPNVVLLMLLGSLPGAWLGSYFSLKAKDRVLRMIFGALLLVLAVVFAHRELNL